MRELELRNISYRSQLSVPLEYKGLVLEADLRCDVLVEDLIVVELKAIDGILPVHEAVLLSYMQMLQKPKGIMINFKCKNIFKSGQRTFVNQYFSVLPKDHF